MKSWGFISANPTQDLVISIELWNEEKYVLKYISNDQAMSKKLSNEYYVTL